MSPDCLPKPETFVGKYLDQVQKSYEDLFTRLSSEVTALIHFRMPDKIAKAKAKARRNSLFDKSWDSIYHDRFNHVVVLVLTDGSCYIGHVNIDPTDKYVRKTGYRLACYKAFRRLDEAKNVRAASSAASGHADSPEGLDRLMNPDFSVGTPLPKRGMNLQAMVVARLHEFCWRYRHVPLPKVR